MHIFNSLHQLMIDTYFMDRKTKEKVYYRLPFYNFFFFYIYVINTLRMN